MRTSSSFLSVSILALTLLGSVGGSALALDPAARVNPDAGPLELFSFGFKAYQRGEKVEAFEALRYAADKGHPGARWKLGRMYAEGDGVPENDYEAFKIFEQIVRDQGEEEGNFTNAAYVSSAVVALADYLRVGISGSPVAVDLQRARQFYFHAASYFGDAKAQFELGRMTLNGEGGKANPRQAARWLNLAAEKGNVGAAALLGYLLFDGDRISLPAQPVRGLGMLTMALKRASPRDEKWIRPLQEEIFAIASESERRTALAYAEQQIASATGVVSTKN
ncbi:putative exopolysaccharide PRODUCTION NEGATIVE REGULATOR [Aurantimonas manganoxydans SI85-9A1]|uniref:Exopolysaccharide regulatory protein ExoR n=2 Tax=Aurantimonas manganoxydans TaxID=651183 RepID=A0A0P0Z518_9HYPH|nr:tetratricopeptide repeat protein [Aurantimonas manganoxydans]EAS50054.1 putative exopolysaccharide PRODUCTION NEGATIVE REGULATOR [Aurantimonas manganoxydans SI85-9A1]BAT29274.1 exopolysaccharide regulatory protein ExoR [Aurantimonas manganoxydans SI85-9A1]